MEYDDLESLQTPSNFNFSAVSIDNLGASEYTLVTILIDNSWSVSDFSDEIENCIKTVVDACKKSPRSENLMIRVVTFDSIVSELHGFKLLSSINEDEYKGTLTCKGSTACYDAIMNAVESTNEYAKILQDQDFISNGIVYVLTDGEDNSSLHNIDQVSKSIDSCKKDEFLESMDVILIGVGYSDLDHYLSVIENSLKLNGHITLTDLFKKESPEQALAKLAGWVSKSISLTSTSLSQGETPNSMSLPLAF